MELLAESACLFPQIPAEVSHLTGDILAVFSSSVEITWPLTWKNFTPLREAVHEVRAGCVCANVAPTLYKSALAKFFQMASVLHPKGGTRLKYLVLTADERDTKSPYILHLLEVHQIYEKKII